MKIKAKSFAVPGIEPGVIVEYQYDEEIKGGGAAGMKLQLQRDIPVQDMRYYYRPYNKKKPSYKLYNTKDVSFVEGENGYYLAERRNVTGFDEEPYMPPDDMVKPWIYLQGTSLSNITYNENSGSISYTTKDPSKPDKYWGGVAFDYQGITKLIKKKEKDVKNLAEQLTTSESTQEGKLKKLYEYCQNEIKNTTYDTTLTEEQREDLPKIESLKDVIKKQQAPSIYVELLFASMANSLGMESGLALMSDRSEMFFNPDMTDEDFVSPGAIAVKENDKWKFYNPGVPFLPFGKLVWYEENVWALVVLEKGWTFQKTQQSDEKENLTKRSGNFKLLEDGTLEGKVTIQYFGQNAVSERLNIYDESEESRKNEVIGDFTVKATDARLRNITIENINDNSKPLVETFDVQIPNYAQKTGKRLFFQPSVFEFGAKPMFSSSQRKYDIYFNFPWSEEDSMTITYPEGYELDNADAPGATSDPKQIGKIDIQIAVKKAQREIDVTRKFHFGSGYNILFQSKVYEPLKNLFDAFSKTDTHTIALKKP
ncbi:MAG: hypothetical protein ACK5NT_13985 [Pyrinomonadaceae bacterium]